MNLIGWPGFFTIRWKKEPLSIKKENKITMTFVTHDKCTHLSIFSAHTGFFSPSQISLTPESSRRLLFRFISFRMVLEERTVARTEQFFSVSSQLFSLNTKTALFIIQHIFNTYQTNRSSYLLSYMTDSLL